MQHDKCVAHHQLVGGKKVNSELEQAARVGFGCWAGNTYLLPKNRIASPLLLIAWTRRRSGFAKAVAGSFGARDAQHAGGGTADGGVPQVMVRLRKHNMQPSELQAST